MRITKRILSLLIALVMVFSLMPTAVFAVVSGEWSHDDFTLTNASVEVDGTTSVEAKVYFQNNVEIECFSAINGVFALKAYKDSNCTEVAENITLTAMSTGFNLGPMDGNTVDGTGGIFSFMDNECRTITAGTAMWTAIYTVDANTEPGTYYVKLDPVSTSDLMDNSLSNEAYNATITVEKPVAPAAAYEIYYELDKADGTDGDKYHEYGIGDTVTATVWIKNNTGTAVSLQAYDIYLTHDSRLTSPSFAPKYDSRGAVQTSGGKVHIQAIGENTSVADINIDLPADGTAVELGSLTFNITDTTANPVAFGDQLHITLADNSDAKAEGNTAIGIADYITVDGATKTTGNKVSYYPGVIAEVLGAEVNTTYTVTYDANGGSFADGATTQTKQHNVDLTIAAPATPTREGFSFVGWSTESGDNNSKNAPTTYTENADETLYAVWQQDVLTITWKNADGSTFDTTTVNYNTAPTAPATNPSKAQDVQYTYTFAGWSASEDGEKIETFPAVTVATTYYPLFTRTLRSYTVTFKSQDGNETLGTETVDYGKKPTYSTIPTKEDTDEFDYEFAGWAGEENQTDGTAVADLPVVQGDVTYYAAFSAATRSYTVTYTAGDHGSFAADADTEESVQYNSNPANAPEVTAATGYTFSGWSDGTKTSTNLSDFTVTKDVTLTAQYAPISYTVKFDLDDGSGTVPGNISATYDADVTMPGGEGLTKEGYIFAGWSLNKEETDTNKIYAAGTKVKNLTSTNGDTVTLYAQWSEASYTVGVGTVENGNVSVSPTTANMNDIITVTVTPNAGYQIDTVTYTKEGETGTNNVTATDGVYSFSMPAANVTVTATFVKKDLAVTVDTDIVGGKVESNKETAQVNDIVTLTPTPDKGYVLGEYIVTYTDDNGEEKTVLVNAAGTFDMPAYPVTVTATFNAIEFTITYDENGGSAIEDGKYTVATETLTLPETTKVGYSFAGWKNATTDEVVSEIVKGTTGDITLTAQWTPNTNTPYTVKHWQQNVGVADTAEKNETNYTLADTENLTGTTATKVTPAVKTTYTGFIAPTAEEIEIAADGSAVLNYYYTRDKFEVTFKDDDKTIYTEEVQFGAPVTKPATDPAKDGYTFEGWEGLPEYMPAADTEITAKWEAVEYIITFDVNGGNDLTGTAYFETNKMKYTIQSTDVLPTPTHSNPLYKFVTWTASDVEGSWTATDYNANTALKDKYGKVTLTAQWDTNFTYKVEEYKYADSGYVMLRIATDSNTNAYTFNGEKMFYTDDANYKLTVKVDGQDVQKAVFVTLIPKDGNVNSDMTLTAAAVGKLEQGTAAAVAVTRDGKINDDSIVNIADANIVYQMIVNGGGYYGNQLLTDKRLGADMVTDADGSSTHRATIADVNAIVNIINGTTTTN